MAKEYTEQLNMKVLKVVRKANNGDVVQDLKEGYVYFDVMLQVNDKNVVFEKRIRLDKPDRMLNKFVSKITALAEERYKDMTYYVADKESPETSTELENEKDVLDKMGLLFGEINQYLKSGNVAVLATKLLEFE